MRKEKNRLKNVRRGESLLFTCERRKKKKREREQMVLLVRSGRGNNGGQAEKKRKGRERRHYGRGKNCKLSTPLLLREN